VEACTVTAPDAITAFAVPNPNWPSQSSRIFRVWSPNRLPCQAGSPNLLRTGEFYLNQSFRSSTAITVVPRWGVVNARFWCSALFIIVAGLLTDSAPGFRQRGVREISTVRERRNRDQQRRNATAAECFSSRWRATAPCLGIRRPLDAQATEGKPDSIARISLTPTATSSKESSGRRSVEWS